MISRVAPSPSPSVNRTEAVAAIAPREAPRFSELRQIAQRSLTGNIHQVGTKHYLSAGANQFGSLWTRDFAWSARGLIAAGRPDVVRDQLTLLLNAMRPSDGLIPRTVDSANPKWRVTLGTIKRLLPFTDMPPIERPLAPEYQDQQGEIPIDGNALVILAATDYVRATGDKAWWAAHEKQLALALRFYDSRLKNGLIVQPPFSDWQDSVRREGATFYTNLIYQTVLQRLAGNPAFAIDPATVRAHKAQMEATFFDRNTGLYRALDHGPWTSLDGNLLALDLGFVPRLTPRADALYAAIKRSPFWTRTGSPGFNTYPDYPSEWRNASVRTIGLGHYHDELQWSWLIALSAKVARAMGDDQGRTVALAKLERLAKRDRGIAEIYDGDERAEPWESLLYRSEKPFSWGAAATLEALQARPR